MSVNDLIETAVPARSFLGNTKLNPLDAGAVARLREWHALIQRDFSGQKKTTARGPLADYIRDEWLPDGAGSPPPAGFLPAFILYFPDKLVMDDDEVTGPYPREGNLVDGESRGDGLLLDGERLDDDALERLLTKKIAVHVIHGIQDPAVIARYFAHVNGKGLQSEPDGHGRLHGPLRRDHEACVRQDGPRAGEHWARNRAGY